MKFVAVILISFAVMAVYSTAIPDDSESSEGAGAPEDNGPDKDLCDPSLWLTIQNKCEGKNETICFDCIKDNCLELYQEDPTACEIIRGCINDSFC